MENVKKYKRNGKRYLSKIFAAMMVISLCMGMGTVRVSAAENAVTIITLQDRWGNMFERRVVTLHAGDTVTAPAVSNRVPYQLFCNRSVTTLQGAVEQSGYDFVGSESNPCFQANLDTVNNNNGEVMVYYATAVNDITNVPSTANGRENLPLSGTIVEVIPRDHLAGLNDTIQWSVADAGTTGATITNNTLSTTAGGTVTVTASVPRGTYDGSSYQDFKKDFTITVTPPPAYSAVHNLTNLTATANTAGQTAAIIGADYATTLSPAAGYTLPGTITVTIGGAEKTAGTDYNYDSTTGVVTISADKVTGAIVITAAGVVAAHTHSYSETWSKDASNHWHECTCGEKADVAAHSFGEWITDTNATKSETGTKHRVCSVCGYQENGTIPKQDDSDSGNNAGNVIKDTPVVGANAPQTALNNSVDTLKNLVLTPEELAQVAGGATAKIYLDIQDISSTISQEEKSLIAGNLGNETLGMYIDLSLYKKVGDNEPVKITNPNGKISISIKIPAQLINTDGTKNRTYKIIRIHNGIASVIEGTYDPATQLFTFETDAFSTYALAYIDNAVTNAAGNVVTNTTDNTAVKDSVPKTGDSSVAIYWLLLATLSGVGAIYFGKRKKLSKDK